MRRGYLKLWKKIVDSEIFKDPNMLQLWIYLLIKTEWTNRIVIIDIGRGKHEVMVKRGQMLLSSRQLQKDLKQNYRSIHRRLNKLEDLGKVLLDVSHHYTIVNIVNYEQYQGNGVTPIANVSHKQINKKQLVRSRF